MQMKSGETCPQCAHTFKRVTEHSEKSCSRLAKRAKRMEFRIAKSDFLNKVFNLDYWEISSYGAALFKEAEIPVESFKITARGWKHYAPKDMQRIFDQIRSKILGKKNRVEQLKRCQDPEYRKILQTELDMVTKKTKFVRA